VRSLVGGASPKEEPASPVLFPASLFPDLMGLKGKDGGSSLLSGRTAFALLKP